MSLEIHLTQMGIAEVGQDRDALELFLPLSLWLICVQNWGQQISACSALLVPAIGNAP